MEGLDKNLLDFLEEEEQNPDPDSNQNPNPDPDPDSGQDPNPDPDPGQDPNPNQNPNPDQNPNLNPNPNPDSDEPTEEELLALANGGNPITPKEPESISNKFEIASFLGVSISGKKPEEVTLSDVKQEFDRYKKVATSDSIPEIAEIKQFLIENKDKTIKDYIGSYVSPLEPLTFFPKESLFMWHRTVVQKKTQEEAKKEMDNLVFDGKFDEEADKLTNIVQQKNKEFYDKQAEKFSGLQKEKEARASQRRQELMTSLLESKNKNSFLGGHVSLNGNTVRSLYEDITSGKVHQQLKDHKVIQEVAWFLQNRERVASIFKSDGSNEQKLELINMLANAKKQQPVRGETAKPKPANGFDMDDWDF